MIEKIQFITNDFNRPHWENAELACKGGIKWIQLRVKNVDDNEWLETAEKTQDVCVKYGAKLIINDNLQIAQKILADGLHLGLDDMPTSKARDIIGENYILGGTANTFEDIIMHCEANVDYIGLGPFTFTDTKKNLSPILGADGYKLIIAKLKSLNIEVPIIAVGGIEIDDIKNILSLGVHGIAISSLITSSSDPIKTVEKVLKQL